MKTTLTLNSIIPGEGLEPRGKKPYVLALLVSGRGLPEGENLEFALSSLPVVQVEPAMLFSVDLLSAEDAGDWIAGEVMVLDSNAGMEAASKVIDRLRPRFEVGPLVSRLHSLAQGVPAPVRVVEHEIGQIMSEVSGALHGGDRVLGRVTVKVPIPGAPLDFAMTDKTGGMQFHFGMPREQPTRKTRRGKKAPKGRRRQP